VVSRADTRNERHYGGKESRTTLSVTVTAEFSEAVAPSVIETIDPAVADVAFQEIVPGTDLLLSEEPRNLSLSTRM
jgi:hypothetical protein